MQAEKKIKCSILMKNRLTALVCVAVNLFVLALVFDYYYDLNDDVMMRDIMAGIYTGTPDGHNMQTLFLLGGFISSLYRICDILPWYGVFLCFCQTLAIYLVLVRILTIVTAWWEKALAVLGMTLFWWSVAAPHFVNVQYTITCAVLSAAAIFLFLTAEEDEGKSFLLKNIPSVLLVALAYMLRTEMLLLTFPFIGLAGMYRWSEEKRIFTTRNIRKYGTIVGAMLLLMIVPLLCDKIAYRSLEWKEFIRFFNDRTTVYDFYPETVTDARYEKALEEIGITPSKHALLQNYNYGLDDDIRQEQMEELADFAKESVSKDRDYREICKKQLYSYLYRSTHGEDFPYNAITVLAYLFLLVFIAANKKWSMLWQPVALGFVRTLLWMFILMRGRAPERITHSLYLVEITLLFGMVMHLYQTGYRRLMVVLTGVLCILFLYRLPETVRLAEQEQTKRETVNRDFYAIDDYCRRHPENYYMEDVYSTVSFSQMVFSSGENAVTKYANYDIMGGWMCNSPLYFEKLQKYGIDSVSNALLEKDNVFIIMSDYERDDRGFEWVTDHYMEQGIAVFVEETDRINDNYAVYRVNRRSSYGEE